MSAHLGSPGFTVLLADPPWTYNDKRTGGSLSSGAAQQYPTLTLAEIRDLPVGDVADPDSVLFLWSTVPLLEEALLVMRAWGYTYKTKVNWDKGTFGMGHWFRGDHEDLLLGVRGDVRPLRCQRRNRVKAKPGRHSAKPPEARALIEHATRNMEGQRLELFARELVAGWHCLGNSIDGRDIRESLPALKPHIELVGGRYL